MSWKDLQPFVEAVVTLFAIINPIYVLPIFSSMTSDATPSEQRMMFRMASIVGSATVIVVGVLGEFVLLNVFHVSLGSMMVACGVLLVIVCVKNMIVEQTEPQSPSLEGVPDERRRQQLIARAVSPMACPVLVGPGSIVTAILIVNRNGFWLGVAAMITASALVVLVMHWGHAITRVLGRIGSLIVSRVLMIFLAAIGMEFVYRGIALWLPTLRDVCR
jgi:multiple antibiotic resistance protein